MECPLCGCRTFFRDSAGPRAYAFLLLGVLLLIGGGLAAPALRPLYMIRGLELSGGDARAALSFDKELGDLSQNLLILGGGAIFIGVFDLLRDRNRFCARCGFRKRLPLRALDEKTREALSAFPGAEQSPRARPAARRAEVGNLPLAPDQPVAPLIKLLRAKDPRRRADAAETLAAITGMGFGADADAWEAWWAEKRQEQKAAPRA